MSPAVPAVVTSPVQWFRRHPRVTDVVVVVLAAADAWFTWPGWGPLVVGCTVLGFVGLLLRRRWPLPAFLLTLPAVPVSGVLVAGVVVLYVLAERTRDRRILTGCVLTWAVLASVPWEGGRSSWSDDAVSLVLFAYAAATAAAPVLLGQLVQAQRELARRLVEIEQVTAHQQQLYAEKVLARERTRLAREMHDVVSHQVTLIVVHAGGWEATAREEDVRQAAGVVRRLGVRTLEELRTMVTVLRLSGNEDLGLTPSPTLADLRDLVRDSEIEVVLEADLPPADRIGLPPQRAVYRVVQEALTNVRKHSPGARTRVCVQHDDVHVTVLVENGPPTLPALSLPGSGTGLVGLRERVEVLDGRFEAGPVPDGGFRVRAVVPLQSP
ncbi:histidine kinase [Kineococcus sp. NBC_00420]|uniref:sensor histidine kinase n=1 Tax=Kineococcus sp. NBC_00420 TaxID=2903564 RepID=UPI002E218711